MMAVVVRKQQQCALLDSVNSHGRNMVGLDGLEVHSCCFVYVLNIDCLKKYIQQSASELFV